MIRLTLLLSSAIFLVFVIGGRDEGQMRKGLMDRPRPVMAAAPSAAPEQMVQVRAEAEPVAMATAQPALQAEPAQIMPVVYINASSVNVRQGPSTQDSIIGRLQRGESALVVWADDTGWSRIRIEGDGIEGYVATRYLTGIPSALAY